MTTTFRDMALERGADRLLGLDQYDDPTEREAARRSLYEQSGIPAETAPAPEEDEGWSFSLDFQPRQPPGAEAPREPRAGDARPEQAAEPPRVPTGRHLQSRVSREAAERKAAQKAEFVNDFVELVYKSGADVAADTAGFIGDVGQKAAQSPEVRAELAAGEAAAAEASQNVGRLMSRWGMEGHNVFEEGRRWVDGMGLPAPVHTVPRKGEMIRARVGPDAPVRGRPTDRSPRTLGVVAESMNWGHQVEAKIRSHVPDSVDPTITRLIGREGWTLAGGWAAAGRLGLKTIGSRVLGAEGLAGAARGLTMNPEQGGEMAELVASVFGDSPELRWLAERNPDEHELNRLKNTVEKYAEFAGFGYILEKTVDLVRTQMPVWKARKALRDASRAAEEAEAAKDAPKADAAQEGAQEAVEAAAAAPPAAPAPDAPVLTKWQRRRLTDEQRAATEGLRPMQVPGLRPGEAPPQPLRVVKTADEAPQAQIADDLDDEAAEYERLAAEDAPQTAPEARFAKLVDDALEAQRAADEAEEASFEQMAAEYEMQAGELFDEPPAIRTPKVDEAEAADPSLKMVETTADEPQTAELPTWQRPVDTWTEAERTDFDTLARSMGGTAIKTEGGAAAVRVGKMQQVLVGQSASGVPVLAPLRMLGEGTEPLAAFTLRQNAKETLAKAARTEAEEIARADALAKEREAEALRRSGDVAEEMAGDAPLTPRVADEGAAPPVRAEDVRPAPEPVDTTAVAKAAEAVEEAKAQTAKTIRETNARLDPLKTADLAAPHPTSPHIIEGTPIKRLDLKGLPVVDAAKVPLHLPVQLRPGNLEDLAFSAQTIDEVADLTKDQLTRLKRAVARREADAAKTGDDAPIDPARRLTSQGEALAHVEQLSKVLGEGKDKAADLAVLRELAGAPVEGADEMTGAMARAWVQVLNHKANRVRDAARLATGRGVDVAAWDKVWHALEEVEQYRGLIRTLRGEHSKAAAHFKGMVEIDRYGPDLGVQEARIRALIQQRHGHWRKSVAFVESVGQKHTWSDVASIGKTIPERRFQRFGEAWQKVALSGMLSLPKTLSLATVSNAIVHVSQVPELYIAAAMRRLLDDGNEMVTWKAANADLAARIPGLAMGLKMGAASAWDGVVGGSRGMARIEAQGLMDVYNRLTRSQRFDLTDLPPGVREQVNAARTLVENMTEAGDRVISVPFALLNGLDLAAKGAAYQGYVARRAHMAAGHRGLSGAEYNKAVKEYMDDPPEHWIEEAVNNAEDMTFTRPFSENESWMLMPMAKVTRAIDRVPPFGRVAISPFLTVPARSLSYAFERLPGIAMAQRHVRADFAAGGHRRQMVLARQAFGASVLVTGFMGAQAGVITGGGSQHPGVHRVQHNIRPPYSIRVGDGWYQYDRLDPLGRLIGVAADMAEIMSFAEDGPVVEGAQEMGSLVLASVLHHMGEGSWMASAGDFATLISESMGYKGHMGGSNALARFAGQKAWSLLPYNNLARGGYRGFDPVYRDTRAVREEGEELQAFFDTMANELKAQVPGWSATLPPRIGMFGEPDYRMAPTWAPAALGWHVLSPAAYHHDTGHKGYKAMMAAEWAPDVWPRRHQGVDYTPEERVAVAKTSGKIFEAYVNRWLEMGHADAYLKAIERADTAETRDAARQAMHDQLDGLWRTALQQGQAGMSVGMTDWHTTRLEIGLRRAKEQEKVRKLIRMGVQP